MKTIIEKRTQENKLIYRINKMSKKGEFYISKLPCFGGGLGVSSLG